MEILSLTLRIRIPSRSQIQLRAGRLLRRLFLQAVLTVAAQGPWYVKNPEQVSSHRTLLSGRKS